MSKTHSIHISLQPTHSENVSLIRPLGGNTEDILIAS